MTIIQNCRCCGNEIFIRDYTSYAVCDRCIGEKRVMVYYSKEEEEKKKEQDHDD